MFKMFFDASDSGAGGGSASAQPADGAQDKGEPLSFEKWIGSQDEEVKGLLDSHTKGLKTALDAERETRKSFEKQIRELAAKAEKGSEAEKQLSDLSAQLELSNRRASFAESASREGVTNPKALFTLAAAGDFFDKKGEVDFASLKKEYPEFFKQPIPQGNAGEGQNSQAPVNSMNDIIRRAAGAK